MSRKVIAIIVLLICISISGKAQSSKNTALVKGKVINSATKKPFNDLKVAIQSLNVFTTTDGDGNFVISEVPYGNQTVTISNYNIQTETINIVVDKGVIDIGDITITQLNTGISEESSEIPTITIEENSNTSSEDDGVSSQNIGGAVTMSRDPFLNTVYSLVALYNFHYRGYKNNPHDFEVNGIPIDNVETGAVSFNQFGKLYDVFRVRDATYGLAPSSYSYGGKNGTEYLDGTASNQRAETKISYTFTDRNYNNGLTLTHSSGLMKNGWAYSVAFAKRFATEGYDPGTFYNDYAYSAAVSKVIGKGTLNLTTVGSPIDHGKSSSATQELYDLDGSRYYNQNWGYDDGKKRNARVEKEFRPLTILNYEYKPSDKTRWNTAVSYETGKDKNSFIDYYNGYSPYGSYYKNLPSYYLTFNPPNPGLAATIKNRIMSNPDSSLQINWARLYQDNYLNTQTLYNINGVSGNNYTGKQSIYVLSNTVNDLKKYTFNTNIEHSVNEHLVVYGGLTFISQVTETYNQLADLLGGDYFVNYNEFASQQYVGSSSFNQNNLNQPNALVKVGDKYGNDYAIHINNGLLWGQAVYTYDKFNFFVAGQGDYNSFYREGFMKNGLFPNNSFGNSTTQNFLTYSVKGGVTYKVDSRNTFFLNGTYGIAPPTADNTYISAATRDFTVANPTTQQNQSAEAGYILRSNKFSARVIGYVSEIKNATEIKRFYNDDPAYSTFVNYVMTGENTRSIGTEISMSYKLLTQLTVVGVASVGQSYYSNNPNINVYLDNDTAQHSTPSRTYIKNYYGAAGPQSSYILGFNYKPRRDLYIDLNFNYFDRNYVEINPNRRTTAAAGLYPAGSPQWQQIYNQEELPSAFTVDLRAGKSFQLSKMSKRINNFSRNTVLNLSASIANLLNNTDVVNSGYEQLRYDFTNNNPAKFANKYIYGMGINFSINANLRF